MSAKSQQLLSIIGKMRNLDSLFVLPPIAIATDQIFDIKSAFWACLAYVIVSICKYRHLERMEDKRNENQQGLIGQLIEHSCNTNKPIVFPINQAGDKLEIGEIPPSPAAKHPGTAETAATVTADSRRSNQRTRSSSRSIKG